MRSPALKIHEKKDKFPVLIIDKKGEIGESLGKELSKDFPVILVSRKSIDETKNFLYVPFSKKFPQIPDNKYSKIYIVDDGSKETREATESLITKARELDAPYFFIGSIRQTSNEISEEQVTYYSSAKSLIVGDLFGDSIDPTENTIQRYIYEARRRGRLEVEGDGLNLNFPVTLSDTTDLILKATHLEFSEKIVLLFSPQPITDLSLAHLFQKADPQIMVDYKKGSTNKNISIPPKALHVISSYNLLEKIKDISLEDTELKLKPQSRVRKPSRLFRIILISIIFILLLPFLSTAVYSGLGFAQLSSAKNSLEKGNIDQAMNNANNSKTFFNIASKTSKGLEYEASFIGQKQRAQNLRKKIEAGRDISIASYLGLEAIQSLKKIHSGKSVDPKEDFAKSSYSLKTSIALLQKAKAQGNLPKDIEEKLTDLEPLIDLTINTSDLLPGILGFEKEKTYLILFQNNMELRPGGGFIGSYGLLTVKNANIKDFKIVDVYETDGQLKEHVEPPFPIRRYLPSAHWYLRDSNFNPDFVKSAISAASIYSLETKKTVDGVIGIDLNFAKNILEALGEVRVNDYKVTINKENLYQETQKRSQDNFFPGSTQKKDFLSSLAKSIEETLKSKKDQPFLGMAMAIGKSVREKNIIFAFQEGVNQDVFTANGWSSSLWDQRSIKDQSIVDYLGLVEANLGVNKSNYFVSRSVSKKIVIGDDGSVTTNLTIAYKNSSPSQGKLGGDYKNYIQLVLPQGAIVDEVKIDGNTTPIQPAITDFYTYERNGFRAPSGLEVDETEELGKKIVGFLVNVPKGKLKTVSLSISLPYKFDLTKPDLSYSLKVFKQPGIGTYPFELTFDLPKGLKVIDKSMVKDQIEKDEEYSLVIGQE